MLHFKDDKREGVRTLYSRPKKWRRLKRLGRMYNPDNEICSGLLQADNTTNSKFKGGSIGDKCKFLGWIRKEDRWLCYKHRNQTRANTEYIKTIKQFGKHDKELEEIDKLLGFK